MRFHHLLWPLLLVCSTALAKSTKEDVEISSKEFDEIPNNLFFFDDSEVAVLIEEDKGVVWRSTDAGEKWKEVKEIKPGNAYAIYPHPYDSNVAVALGRKFVHWITYDQGDSWREFKSKEHPSTRTPLSFHTDDSKRILFNAAELCEFFNCIGTTYYTTDGFKSMELMHKNRKMCIYARSTDTFSTGISKRDENLVACIVEGKYSSRIKYHRLVTTEDYFKTEHEPTMSDGRVVPGMSNLAAIKGFIVAAAKAEGSSELALYVTKDGSAWHRAEFGDHRVEEDAYTILESTNYSMQVDVRTHKNAEIGSLFTSNSNGTYFTRNIAHTNRDEYGTVDFEKIQNIQGIVMVNVVENWEEVQRPDFRGKKKIKTKISFDDGREFEPMMCDGKELHLHSVTEQRNSGRIFSSPAPGIVMGNGNVGESLGDFEDSDLFVSDDAGRTWTKTSLEGPHKYEFGDQGALLVAIPEGDTDKAFYSLNHGKDWVETKLPEKVVALEFTTIPDSTGLKFLVIAHKGDKYYTIALDFDHLQERKCKSGDFEDWYARKDEEGEPTCIMGHTQRFRRRKANAECFVDEEFKDPVPETERCDCTEADFECDTNFVRHIDDSRKKTCKLEGQLPIPDGECKDSESTFMGSSGWRLIPGNDCKRTHGEQKDDPVSRPCSDAKAPQSTGDIDSVISKFPGSRFMSMYYLERDSTKAHDNDETVVMLTDEAVAWKSHDHGKEWDKINTDGDEIVAIYPHQYNNDYVYFITPSKTVWYSEDRAKVIHSFTAPDVPNTDRLAILSFHEHEENWIMWTGNQDCVGGNHRNCHTVAHISKNNGLEWHPLLRFVKKCQFMYREGQQRDQDLIFCEQHEAEDPHKPVQLLSSKDSFQHRDVVFSDIVDFATMAEFIVVAAKDAEGKFLKAHSSLDGTTFAHAAFPPNFEVEHERAYTVLDSSTNAIFLHVTVSDKEDHEYGTILKSNSNGTFYVISIENVNRNRDGFVDFEKMQGVEGVAMVNVVANPGDADNGAKKKLQTMITHDDGSQWGFLPPPELDGAKKGYECAKMSDKEKEQGKCALHLHGYTERKDPRETFSSPSAVGLMMGVGNVGEYLTPYNEGDTFITKDGGITWKAVAEGTFMWEYGDQGSIIVIVEREEPTKRVLYSVDEGEEWKTFIFSDSAVTVERITTVPSDNSRKFLLWGRLGHQLVTVHLDFSGLTSDKCELDKEHIDDPKNDYYLWSPEHPLKKEEKDCLFGHKSRFYRKKPTSNCFNGPMIDKLHDIEKNCSCTRQDFECDYNYQRAGDGSCKLIEGLQPSPPQDMCKAPGVKEYHESTGYRKIPLSTCSQGRELEWTGQRYPCPGFEKEFEEKHRVSGAALFFSIVLPIGAAAGIGWWVYRKWDGKFGRIRLGDTPSLSNDSPWISWPVAMVSGVVAVAAAVPLVLGSLWRSVSGWFAGYGTRTYTSRSSFARGRGDYAVVDNDEGELLGEESDEEV